MVEIQHDAVSLRLTASFAMYGSKILIEISKVPFETSHEISILA